MQRFLYLSAMLFLTSLYAMQAAADPPDATVKITLYPAAAPRPALKYQLLPPFLERRPGNAAVWWNRLLAERQQYYAEFDNKFLMNGKYEKWMDIPIGDPREKEYRQKELAEVIPLLNTESIFRDMERAASYESCDWQLPVREGDFYSILLPEVQNTREYARILCAKAHLEIAEGKFDEAVRTLQVGYALGRHVGNPGICLVQNLVGATIAGIMSHQVEAFIQQPGAPNLYWALATLPRPLIDFRQAFEAESVAVYLSFPELCDIDKKKYPPDQWRQILEKLVDMIIKYSYEYRGMQSSRNKKTTKFYIMADIVSRYHAAKRFLIEQGRSAEEVEAMPVAQVVVLHTMIIYDEFSQEQAKWMMVPYAQGRKGMRQSENQLADLHRSGREIIPLASMLLPAVCAAKAAEARTDRSIAALQVLEALRIYAASHDGRLPEKLTDITEVPIPPDPTRDEPFGYRREGDKAFLESPDPYSGGYSGYGAIRYQIEMKQQGAKP
jgi:hypothetical protein